MTVSVRDGRRDKEKTAEIPAQGSLPITPIADKSHFHPSSPHHRPSSPVALETNLLIPLGLPVPAASHGIAHRHVLKAAMFDKEQLWAMI